MINPKMIHTTKYIYIYSYTHSNKRGKKCVFELPAQLTYTKVHI